MGFRGIGRTARIIALAPVLCAMLTMAPQPGLATAAPAQAQGQAGGQQPQQEAPLPITQERFIIKLLQQLRAAGATEITRKGHLHIEVMFGDQGPVTMYLDNAWQTYLGDPGDPDRVIASVVKAVVRPLDLGLPIDHGAIVPVIRHREFLAGTLDASANATPAERPAKTLAHYVLNDELVLFFAEDGADRIRYLTQADVQELEIDGDPLFRLALNNLMRRVPGMERVGDKVIMIQAGGVYESSMVLARHIWTPSNFPVEGEYVFAIPARDVVLLTGSAQTEDVAALRRMARQIAGESAYSISDRLFRFAPNGGIVLFDQ